MNLSVGIVGLPNAGKSTLFNALLKRQIAQVAEYPFTTIEPNKGVVEVLDERLAKLAEILRGKDTKILSENAPNISISQYPSIPKIVPSAIEFIDIAGLVKGAHQGQGLGNAFLGHIREVDAILHIIRFFDYFKSPDTGEYLVRNVTHVMDSVHPLRDIEVVNEELRLAGIKKPTLYLINIDENLLSKTGLQGELRDELKLKLKIGNPIFSCIKLEGEIGELPEAEQKDYLGQLGVEELSLDKVIEESYKLLDLITFFTIKGAEPSFAKASEGRGQIQAWPLKKGKTAFEAAGEVHTDFAKGFIKAEVINVEKLLNAGGWQKAKENGKVRVEGKDYIVNDGDVIEFRFGS